MYNKTVDIVKSGAGKVSADIVFWAGIAVIAVVLVLGIIRVARRQCPLTGVILRGVTKAVTLLYFAFAYFVISTAYTLSFSNMAEYMGFPVAVVLTAYLFYLIFMGNSYCKCGCGTAAAEQEKEEENTKEPKPAREENGRQKRKEEKQKAKELKKHEKEKQREKAERQAEQERQEREMAKEEKRKQAEQMKAEKAEKEVQRKEKEEEPQKEAAEEQKEEEQMFVVSKVMDDKKPEEYIRPVSTAVSEEERISNISRLAEQIERKRQANIDITDGKKENKFVSSFVAETPKTIGTEPKVVARKITETVTVRPLDTTPKTGFTAKRITETTTTQKTYTGTGITASRTATVGGSASRTAAATDSKKRADDILAALEKLRSSMKK
jgi:hypothetical protein